MNAQPAQRVGQFRAEEGTFGIHFQQRIIVKCQVRQHGCRDAGVIRFHGRDMLHIHGAEHQLVKHVGIVAQSAVGVQLHRYTPLCGFLDSVAHLLIQLIGYGVTAVLIAHFQRNWGKAAAVTGRCITAVAAAVRILAPSARAHAHDHCCRQDHCHQFFLHFFLSFSSSESRSCLKTISIPTSANYHAPSST